MKFANLYSGFWHGLVGSYQCMHVTVLRESPSTSKGPGRPRQSGKPPVVKSKWEVVASSASTSWSWVRLRDKRSMSSRLSEPSVRVLTQYSGVSSSYSQLLRSIDTAYPKKQKHDIWQSNRTGEHPHTIEPRSQKSLLAVAHFTTLSIRSLSCKGIYTLCMIEILKYFWHHVKTMFVWANLLVVSQLRLHILLAV